MSIMLFFTAQARYSVKSDFRDSYMQYMTDDKAVVVWGKITKTEYKNGSYRFYLSDCTVAGKMSPDSEFSVCGSVILYCDEEAAKLGDYVRADGNVKLFSSATNEGEFDRKAFYSSQGIDFGLKTGKIKAKLPEYAWFYHGLQRLRDNMSEALIDVTDGKTAGVLSSMLLGDKAFLDEDIKDLYQVTGISHILAISGVKTLKLDIRLVPETRINWAFVPLHIAIIYILKLCLNEEIIPRCRFPCSRGYRKKYINWQKKQ